jgi:cytochrome c oxidase cbb3-type subunit 2
MYERLDPSLYISHLLPQQVQHVVQEKNLFAYVESDAFHIHAEKELESYITPKNADTIRLTPRLLMLKKGAESGSYELYDPKLQEGFICCLEGKNLEHWIDEGKYELIDSKDGAFEGGQLYVKNPFEFRISLEGTFDLEGQPIENLAQLTGAPLVFQSRKRWIEEGERIYAIEGCWYCHTDQTRTLVQDTVLNGTDAYPAPPSSANEYIYQKITFPGTRRIGPDLSREGVKRPSRDWHKSHFWDPKSLIPESIMPSFRHFFAGDVKQPNADFEAIFQYLMVKGTRITAPTESWWQGEDPVNTKKLIEVKDAP